MKKQLVLIFLAFFYSIVFTVCVVFALEDKGLELIETAADIDFTVLQNNQSKTVTADLNFPLDFGIIPVTLIGNGKFSAKFSRTNTTNELVYVYLYVLKGFGSPRSDFNFGVTPVTLNSSTTISDDLDFDLAFVLVMHGILNSPGDPPYEYSVDLSF